MKKNFRHCERSEAISNRLLHFLWKLAMTIVIITISSRGFAEDTMEQRGVFNDTDTLSGYANEYRDESKETLTGRITDDSLNDYQNAAAIRVFREKFSENIFGREKILLEQNLVRRINRSNSPFVDVEIMHTLCVLDRYRYFDAMMPALLLKLDHYNLTINEMAEKAIDDIIAKGKNSSRDARIIFNTLRKVFFLSRNTLKQLSQPDQRLTKKLKFLRWSIKVLGAQEVKRLPKEMIHLI